jgi:competence ComEA-like helix-hairpin-helix protein
MARISLRSYNHEIEELIERGQYDQAIAHCRHILKFYPKYIDTYRLLGKVYLESQHYGDAADILQRILSSVPEDFVSHVGMSIIREDEGNLDDAIWHMERAFEMQPANSAIQGELRRLYSRRDGVEPPKVRLTRGALARMYFKGNLYPQAIAEIRVALAEESTRLDLQALLAQAYYLSGLRVEAAETCSGLLKKLPYCLEANRILAEVLIDTERADEAQAYRQRVQALNPYSAHISPNAPTSDKVPDTAVAIEKLEWKPGQVSGTLSTQPEWAASLGVEVGELANKEDELPDWLTGTPTESPSTMEETYAQESAPPFDETSGVQPPNEQEHTVEPTQDEESTGQPASEDVIPGWMKEAGWEPASDRTDDSTVPLELDENGDLEGELAPAEIPEWLQAIAPEDALEGDEDTVSQPEEQTGELLPWLDETAPEPAGSEESWLESSQDETISDSETGKLKQDEIPVGETPEWLESSNEKEEVEIPDWLKELSIEGPSEEPSSETEIGNEPISQEPAAEEFVEQELEPEPPAVELESELSEQKIEDQAEVTSPDIEDSQDVSEWLRGLDEESAPTDLSQEVSSDETTSESTPEATGEPATELDDAAAFEWLESLAAKQGADESLLFTSEDRQDTPPEWVQKSLESAPEGEDLTQISEEEVGETREVQAAVDVPDWVRDLEESSEAVSTTGEAATGEINEQDTDEQLPGWLQGLTEEAVRGDEEDLIGQTQDEGFDSSAQAADELPDWLQELKETPIESEVESNQIVQMSEEKTPDSEDLPDWLRNVEEEVEFEDTQLQAESREGEIQIDDGITGWLHRLDETPGQKEVDGFEVSPLEVAGAHKITSELPDWLSVEEESAPDAGALPPDKDAEQVESYEPELSADKFQKLEEPPLVEGDTKPSYIRKSEDAEAPTEIFEPAGSKLEGDGTDLEDTTSALEEGMFEQEEYTELEIPEQSQEEYLEAVSSEAPFESTSLEEESSATEVQGLEEDADAAFAWLESLAARQGASEEDLLLSPEERHETPPEWVQQAETEETTADLERESEWIQESTETQPEESPEMVSDWVEETVESEIGQPSDESEVEEGEGIPELPDWLVEIEESEAVDTSEAAWSPPPEESLPELETVRGEDLQPEEIIETIEEERPESEAAGVLNINQAGLVELERLPGIGFTRAQAIIAYRETFGPFSSVEDLQNVAGIGPIHVDGIRDLVKFEEPREEEITGQPVDEYQMTLIQARNALIQGDSEDAIGQYLNLIQARRLLPDVIHDLHEALYRFPVDVTIWQTLGDAYMRSGQLQDALDAYTKAEELLR